MPIIDLAATRIEDDAEPQTGDLRLWSVTTILNAVGKGEGLMVWACRLAAAAALDDIDRLVAARYMFERDEAIRWIGGAKERAKKGELSDKDLGTVGHSCYEEYALTGLRPNREFIEARVASAGGPKFPRAAIDNEVALLGVFLDRFDAWLQRFQPVYKAAEFVVYSTTYGYAGTSDGIFGLPMQADADPMDVIFDSKFTRKPRDSKDKPKRPYTETCLQLAGYRYAGLAAGVVARRYSYYNRRYYLLSPAEQALATPVPVVDGAVCLLTTPESCDAFPMRANAATFQAFLFVLEVARWQYQTSKGAVGDPLVATRKD